jgi:hypothetical protein
VIDVKCDKKKVFLETYGWPLVQVPYDDFEAVNEDKWFEMNGIEEK